MRASLLNDQGEIIEEVVIVEDYFKCALIERYNPVSEEWERETVNGIYLRKYEITADFVGNKIS